jgi:hypothetical protein
MTTPRIDIRHHVAAIRVNNEHDCWAAVAAMVMRRHSQAGVDHVLSLAQHAGVPLDAGTLPETSVQRFAHAVHLKLHTLRERISLSRMEELLKRGPLAAFGVFMQTNQPATNHAVTIYALVGNGTPRHTRVHLIDPSPSAPTPHYSRDWAGFISNSHIEYILSR